MSSVANINKHYDDDHHHNNNINNNDNNDNNTPHRRTDFLAVPGDDDAQSPNMADPFTATSTAGGLNHHRFANFDTQFFSIGSGASPEQAKRALEAHLAETERRIQDASRLGTSLVEQRQELAARLEEVEQQQAESELSPELKQKLNEIEKEYNEVGRDAARAFLPKQRIPSNELGPNSPFSPEKKRSVSPSKFESQATASPSKLNVPNRKQRNQASNRIHDIEFATEISTSLLAQVRHLQGLLAEKEETLRTTTAEKSQLEDEVEATRQRLRGLDDNEQRYKDENWSLETQLQEQITNAKEAASREQKLSQALSVLQAEKASAQKELDEIKLTYAKLSEEHASAIKHHDTELGSVKRSMLMAETERGALQRKVEELASQNQELAKAVLAGHRARQEEEEQARKLSDEDFETAEDSITPENSPPPSPIKATPRHGMLESETLKSSLQHAHRMIQSLKSNIHREKTEKLDLKRILQETRDELEIQRNNNTNAFPSSASRRPRKSDIRDFKKPPRPQHLGGARAVKAEILVEDPNWEDQSEISPHRVRQYVEASDQFETAHETSDNFETADERATETEAFQTGLEDNNSDSTETEGAGGTLRRKKASDFSLRRRRGSAGSFQSTASTSAEEYGFDEVDTPVQQSRMRMRNSRVGLRRSRFDSEEPYQSSPVNRPPTSSSHGTQKAGGQSLFAELGELGTSDDDAEGYYEGTPNGSPTRKSPTPFLPPPPKPEMVDQGVMTELVVEPLSMVNILSSHVEPIAIPEPQPAPLDFSTIRSLGTEPVAPLPAPLSVSSISALHTEPIAPKPPAPKPLTVSSISALHTEPISPVLPPPAALAFSSVRGLHSEPIESPVEPPAPLAYSSILASHTEPIEPVLPKEPEPEPLAYSSISSLHTEPVKPREPEPEPLGFSSIAALHTEPISPVLPSPAALAFSAVKGLHSDPIESPVEPAPALGYSSISALHTEPIEPVLPREPEPEPIEPAAFAFAPIQALHTEPIEPVIHRSSEPEIVPPAALAISAINAQHVEPVHPKEPEPVPAAPLAYAAIQALHTEPIEPVLPKEPVPAPPAALKFSSIQSTHTEPIAPAEVKPAPLALSSVGSWGLEPVEPPTPKAPEPAPLAYASIRSLHSEPIEPKTPEPAPLAYASIKSLHSEPIETLEPAPVPLAFSNISSLHAHPVEPKAPEPAPLAYSSVGSWGLEPVDPPTPKAAPLDFASIRSLHAEPVEPLAPVAAPLGVSSIKSLHTEPISPVQPTPDALGYSNINSIHSEPVEAPATSHDVGLFAISEGEHELEDDQPQTPRRGISSRKARDVAIPVIAEDETRQSPSDSPLAETPESQRPFKEVVNDALPRSSRKVQVPMTDGGSQTALTSEQIENMLNDKAKRQDIILAEDSLRPTSSASQRMGRRLSHDSMSSATRVKSTNAFDEAFADARRPPSRSSAVSHPPLPVDHKQAIAAAQRARQGDDQSSVTQASSPGSMGPPPLPPSILKRETSLRPKTPTQNPLQTSSSHATPKTNRDLYTPSVAKSRRSSVTSFASEVDNRFNLRALAAGGADFQPGTDPRMIQAITQTMIGEHMWKYTRSFGRGELSENRHRRFFWVHPYTRTLYWSDRDPATGGKAELKTKSVPIEAVRVVTDDNPMPPGLHRKSLIVVAPGRTIKFTAVTGQRHETWFNALSYLLLRTGVPVEEVAGEATTAMLAGEDVDDFENYGRTSRAAPSLSSYHSRTTRNDSPSRKPRIEVGNVPTLTPSPNASKDRPGALSRFSNYLKPASIKSRNSTIGRQGSESIYQASEVHDSAEDLREIYEQQDRDADRLEDVRACCDGKHHVGHLARHSGRHSSATHRHPSATPTGRHSAMA